MASRKLSITDLMQKKEKGEKITMLTAYDYPFAAMLDEAGIDMILVGDSAANVVLGYPDTLPVTMDELLVLTKAAARAVRRGMVIGDMPFGSYNVSVRDAIRSGNRFIKEAGVDGVKLEGGGGVIDTVRALVRAGIPTVGHLGLTPQTAGMLGGYRVQARTAEAAVRLVEDALGLQEAGAFCLVVECIPDLVARTLARKVRIPVIGIGAGPHCDGQVLVLHDMLGLKAGFNPRFAKKYAELCEIVSGALSRYREDVEGRVFPAEEHTFVMQEEEAEKFRAMVKL